MGDFNSAYDPTKVYSDSEQSGFDDQTGSHDDEHFNSKIARISSTTLTKALLLATSTDNDFDSLCTSCIASKQTRVVIQNKPMTKVNKKLEEVYIDLWGPHYPPSLSGKTYAAILLDAKTQKSWVVYLRSKDKFVDTFQTWLPVVENYCNKSMKALCADGGGEFILTKLKDFCEKKGITIKYAAPYMHEENGVAEQGWKTIVTMKDSLLIDSGLPLEFWAEAMDTANYLRNCFPTKSQRGKIIPEKNRPGEKQNVSHVKVFGSAVSIVILKEKRHKSDIYKNWKGIFIGYSQDTTKHICAWAPKTQQILLVSEPYIDESEQGVKLLVEHPLDLSWLPATGLKRKAPTGEPKPRDRPRKVVAPSAPEPDLLTAAGHLERSGPDEIINVDDDVNTPSEKIMSMAETSSRVYEPKTYEEAITDPIHSRQWKEAIEEEIQNLENHQT